MARRREAERQGGGEGRGCGLGDPAKAPKREWQSPPAGCGSFDSEEVTRHGDNLEEDRQQRQKDMAKGVVNKEEVVKQEQSVKVEERSGVETRNLC